MPKCSWYNNCGYLLEAAHPAVTAVNQLGGLDRLTPTGAQAHPPGLVQTRQQTAGQTAELQRQSPRKE